MHRIYERRMRDRVERALTYARVVLLLGPRQSGKSTLVTEIVSGGSGRRHIDLDDQATRVLAEADPHGFLAEVGLPLAVDEIQRVPELLMAVKRIVDRDNSPGQFLLTGSANVLTAPKILDALTGRTDIVNLWPLSVDEILAPAGSLAAGNLVDRLFDADPPRIVGAEVGRPAWLELALKGGYPEVLRRPGAAARGAWFEAYLESLITRDLRDLADVQRLVELPNLLRNVAGQVGSTLVIDRLSQRTGLARSTIQAYLRLLETLFLIRTLPAWRPGLAGRERRAPKVIFADTGLLAYLLGADADRVTADLNLTGALFENLVLMELIKQAAWSKRSVTPLHYRREGREVDLILESRSGDFVAVEAKASSSIGLSDRKALNELREARPSRFKAGVLLYTGAETLPLGKNVWALPVSALWASTSRGAAR